MRIGNARAVGVSNRRLELCDRLPKFLDGEIDLTKTEVTDIAIWMLCQPLPIGFGGIGISFELEVALAEEEVRVCNGLDLQTAAQGFDRFLVLSSQDICNPQRVECFR